MKSTTLFAGILLTLLHAGTAGATSVNLNIYVDDFGIFDLDGSLVGSYDNPAAAGNIVATLNLTPGWHDITFDYKNQAGTNFLAFQWQLPGDSALSVVPLSDFRSLDAGSNLITGLRADYYDLSGNFQFTVFGEGPIDNGATSFVTEVYEGAPGLWAGVYGPSSDFEERLTGQIFIPGAMPEPSGFLPLGLCGAGFALTRFRRRKHHPPAR